ncbi:MAG: leucine-rich repeat domain-containing protein [Lachnospiraceae bacterium]|nr:leucine-rich repeat domain-containing protein [Lachnospiraceae bacterium]
MMNLNLSAKNYVPENGSSGNMTFSRVVRITSKMLVGAVLALVCVLLAGVLSSRTCVWAKSEQYTLNDKEIGSYSDVDYIRVDGIDGGYIGFDRNTGYITWINEDVTEAVIPSEIDGVSVKGIADWVAQDREGLKKVIIPEGIEAVGQGAFRGSSIKEITFPSSMKSLGNYSLGGVRLLKV